MAVLEKISLSGAEARVSRRMALWKSTEGGLLLVEQAAVGLHRGHGAKSDGGLEEAEGGHAAH